VGRATEERPLSDSAGSVGRATEERPLTDSAGSVGRATEDRPMTEMASAWARARRAAARLRRTLVQMCIVVVVGGDKATKA
jgi:hypothetical protein